MKLFMNMIIIISLDLQNIKKTQKRANALQNITIPNYEVLVKTIENALEDKEREEFTRLKVIKSRVK